MKVACISRFESFGPKGALAHRLEEEFLKAGHSYTRINPDNISLAYDGDKFPLSHPEYNFSDFDIFDHAMRFDDSFGWEVVDCLREWGHTVLRSAQYPSADKVTMARLFARSGIKAPKTTIADTAERALQAAKELGFPVVGKARTGSQGRNVRLIEDEKQMREFVTMALEVAPNFLLQEVILPMGADIRFFVVGEKVAAAMRRYAPEGDFRSNYSLSKRADPYTPSAEEVALAVKVVQLYDANFAGVDVMYAGKTPYVLELNKMPGLHIEHVTGINVARQIVEFYENQYKKALKAKK